MSEGLWYVDLANRLRVPAPWIGLGLAGLIWGVNAVVGVDPGQRSLESRVPYVLGAVVAYLFAVSPWSIRKAQQDLDGLRPHWRQGNFAAERRALAHLPHRVMLACTAAALVVALTIQETMFSRFSRLPDVGWTFLDVWMIVLGIALWAILLPAGTLAIRSALSLRRVGRDSIEIALWGVDQAAPLARFGLRTLLTWLVAPLGIVAIAAALGATTLSVAIPIWLSNAAGAFFCLLVPISPVRNRIRARKLAEVVRIDRALAGDPRPMAESELGDEAAAMGRLRLLQWRREVEAMREWPLDAPLVRRFALFVLLPIFSWVAAALVERGLDVFLGR